MAVDNNITIKFKASGAPKLKAAIKALADEQDRLNKKYKGYVKATDSGTKGNRLLNNSLATMRSKLLLVNFAMAMGIKQLIDFTKQAAKIEAMELAFNTLSGGGEKASISMTKLKEATNGTMSEMDLFQQANNAMILGVSKNSDEMAEMFDIAQRLGRALGRDTKSSVESLITGIGRQSRLMLDNIGIIVRADEAYGAYADKLGITADKLSDADKKQAFLTATMESAREKVGSLNKEVLGLQDSYDKLGASTENATTEFGELISKVFALSDTGGFISNLIDMTGLWIKMNNDAIDESQKMAANLDETTAAFVRSRNGTEELGESFEIARDSIGEFFDYIRPATTDFIANLSSTEPVFADYSDGLNDITRTLKIAGMAQQQYAQHITASAFATGLANEDLGKSLEKTGQMIIQDLAFQATMYLLKDAVAKLGWIGIPLAATASTVVGNLVGQASKMKFEDGGMVGGRRHSQGGTMIEAEQGEFVMSRNAVNAVGVEAMNRINSGGGAGAVSINFTGNVMSQDFIEDEAIPMIKEAIRRGADIGVA